MLKKGRGSEKKGEKRGKKKKKKVRVFKGEKYLKFVSPFMNIYHGKQIKIHFLCQAGGEEGRGEGKSWEKGSGKGREKGRERGKEK